MSSKPDNPAKLAPPPPPADPRTSAGNHYWSVDSTPARLTRQLPKTAAPMVLLLFTAISTMILFAMINVPWLRETFPSGDLVLAPYTGTHSIPLRIFILSFYWAFAFVAGGASLLGRTQFLFDTRLQFIALCCLFDVTSVILYESTGFIYSLHVVEILSGIFGFFIFSMNLLAHGSMPSRVATPFSPRYKLFAFLRLSIAVALAIAASVVIDRLDLPIIGDMRSVALLGGTGPGVFLFLPLLFLVLYIDGTLQSLIRRRRDHQPPVTVIIPAHNEAHVIGRTIEAIARSAQNYAATVHVIVLDNCSHDDTAAIARKAFEAAPHLAGRIVAVPIPGKSFALNRGIAETQTEYVIRIDADTQVLPDTFRNAMRHFSRDGVGVVGGLPLPPGDGPFDRARALEVLLKHGYYQVGYSAIDAIVGVPGMFAAYRTQCVRDVGGFVTGMNGEDTDVSVRIGESGWRIVGDPSVTYISEVPLTWRHMREQRLRWFRSIYHVSARNRSYLDGWRFSVRGKIVLPFMLINSARRAMMVPLIIYGFLYLGFSVDPGGTLTVQAVFAVMLGAPALMAGFAALANGRPQALIGLPEYIAFRIVRAYFTLESVLSIAFTDTRRGRTIKL